MTDKLSRDFMTLRLEEGISKVDFEGCDGIFWLDRSSIAFSLSNSP
jgi:hypothetical protein